MVPGAGIEPTWCESESHVLPLNEPGMVGAQGVEPRMPKRVVYSHLSDRRSPLPWCSRYESNVPSMIRSHRSAIPRRKHGMWGESEAPTFARHDPDVEPGIEPCSYSLSPHRSAWENRTPFTCLRNKGLAINRMRQEWTRWELNPGVGLYQVPST